MTALILATVCAWSQTVSAHSPVRVSLNAAPSSTSDAGNPHQESALDRLVEEKCPGAMERQTQRRNANWMPAVGEPNRPALRRELLLMRDRDQEFREAAITHGADAAVMQIDAANLRRLKHIVTQDGFPTRTMVGDDGVNAAWLLTQHADSDPAFQSRVLKIMAARGRHHAFNPADVAMLTDRVLIHQGKPQRYGTQFGNDGSGLKPGKMEDPAHVDQRRASVGLGPLVEYSCVIQAVYGTSGEGSGR